MDYRSDSDRSVLFCLGNCFGLGPLRGKMCAISIWGSGLETLRLFAGNYRGFGRNIKYRNCLVIVGDCQWAYGNSQSIGSGTSVS